MFTFAPATPGTALTAFSTHVGHFASDRTSRRRQCHVDADKTAVVYINVVNQPQFVNVRRNFRIIDGFQRSDDGIRQLAQFVRPHLRGRPDLHIMTRRRFRFRSRGSARRPCPSPTGKAFARGSALPPAHQLRRRCCRAQTRRGRWMSLRTFSIAASRNAFQP